MEPDNEFLCKYIREKGGVITPGELKELKEPEENRLQRLSLYMLKLSGTLNKDTHGNYYLHGEKPDQYRLIQKRSDKLIFSYETGAYLLGLINEEPPLINITVPQGKNISGIRKDYDNAVFHYCKKDLWDCGIISTDSPKGYKIRVYNPERCVCEIIKNKDKTDKSLYNKIIKAYFGKMLDPEKILEYSKVFNVETSVRDYLELLQ
ncbi:MAG: abortive infection protein [Lachnospiraceae bacterium]|nr:abortive infection protein [Lachnospiraceae bacterium]